MDTKPGAVRQGGVAFVIAALLLVFSGVVAGAAVAQPEKEPDTTLDDHPSGKDRSVEPGNSGTQGKAASDPDEDANLGPDKPEGAGGFDSDKDGNNGCGNDDDFEDDNNGNCRGRVQAATTTTTTQSVTTPTTSTQSVTPAPASVLGVTLERPQPAAPVVAGTTTVRAGELAATGFSASVLLTWALALIALGALLLMSGTRRRTA